MQESEYSVASDTLRHITLEEGRKKFTERRQMPRDHGRCGGAERECGVCFFLVHSPWRCLRRVSLPTRSACGTETGKKVLPSRMKVLPLPRKEVPYNLPLSPAQPSVVFFSHSGRGETCATDGVQSHTVCTAGRGRLTDHQTSSSFSFSFSSFFLNFLSPSSHKENST